MKKIWNKPACVTLHAKDLEKHIQVAAWSGCLSCVFR